MEREHLPAKGAYYLLVAAALVVVIAGLRAAESIVVPLLFAAFITVITAPGLAWLQRKGVPAAVSLLLVLVFVVLIVLTVALLLGSTIQDLSSKLPRYQELLIEKEEAVVTRLRSWDIPVDDEGWLDLVDARSATRLFGYLLNSLARILSNALLILLLVAFMLAEAAWLPDKLRAAFGGGGATTDRVARIIENVRHYMVMKTGVSLVTGALVGIGVAMLGVPYALLWGLLAFLFNYIPNIGPIIPAIPAVLLALLEQGLGTAAWTGVVFLAVNQVLGNLVEPRLMGRGLGLSTLVVFVSLIFWGWVLGPVGMLLSAPLTMAAKIVLEGFDDTRWIAVLMGGPTLGPSGAGKKDSQSLAG